MFGNLIARRNKETGIISITNSGWKSNTTKERLNALPNVSISQEKGKWYLNGELWDGSWKEIPRVKVLIAANEDHTSIDIFYENAFAPFHTVNSDKEALRYCEENNFEIISAID